MHNLKTVLRFNAGGSLPYFSKLIITPACIFVTRDSKHWRSIRCDEIKYDRPPVTSHILLIGELLAYGMNVFELDS